MPYTNAWSDAIPAGSVPANTIDEQIRQLRLDIHERLDDVVVDWTTDPVVPKAAVGASQSAVAYDDSGSVGSKASDYTSIVALLTLRFVGTAVNKSVTINLNEVNTLTGTTNWQTANLFLPAISSGISLPFAFVGRLGNADDGLVLRRMVVDDPSNTIVLVLEAAGGMSVIPQPVDIQITLAFTVAP